MMSEWILFPHVLVKYKKSQKEEGVRKEKKIIKHEKKVAQRERERERERMVLTQGQSSGPVYGSPGVWNFLPIAIQSSACER